MSRLLQGAVLLGVLTVLTAGGRRAPRAGRSVQCVGEDRPACVSLDKLSQLLGKISTAGINMSHDERILLFVKDFKRLRRKQHLHGCVLLKILDFFVDVLGKRGEHAPLRTFVSGMKECVTMREKSQRCVSLYHEAKHGPPGNQSLPIADLKPKQVALLQLYVLQSTRRQLSEDATLDKAMAELVGLRSYITPGRGWRRWKKEADRKKG